MPAVSESMATEDSSPTDPLSSVPGDAVVAPEVEVSSVFTHLVADTRSPWLLCALPYPAAGT